MKKKQRLNSKQSNKAKRADKKEPGYVKWAPAAIVLFTALLYYRAVFNGFVNIDDDHYIAMNPFIKDFSWHGIWAVFTSFYFFNYHPLTTLSYLIEYSLFGLKPHSYHLFNVLLHLVNTWLVYQLMLKLSNKKLTAIIVTVLFAIHPMHVESVAWISERKAVLYACFYLLSLIAYLRYFDAGMKRKYYTGALLFFILSLLSKASAVTLPVLLIAIDFYKGRKMDKHAYLEKIPFFALSILFGIIAIISQQAVELEKAIPVSYNFIQWIFLYAYAIAFYLVQLIAPIKLTVLHPFPNSTVGSLPWDYYASLPFLLVLVWLIIRKTALRKEILFGVFFFLITISIKLPAMHLGNSIVSERYTYLNYFGLFYIAGQFISYTKIQLRRDSYIAVFAGFVILFSIITWNRIEEWKDNDALFTDIIYDYPNHYEGYLMRAESRKNKGDLTGAIQDYTLAIELKPGKGDEFAAHYNRGIVYNFAGDKKSALLDFDKALKLNPEYIPGYNVRGLARAQTGDFKGARIDFDKAISLAPVNATYYYNRGRLKQKTGDFIGSLADLNRSIKLDASDSSPYYHRGIVRFNLKDTSGACTDWKKAAQMGYEGAGQMMQQYCQKK